MAVKKNEDQRLFYIWDIVIISGFVRYGRNNDTYLENGELKVT